METSDQNPLSLAIGPDPDEHGYHWTLWTDGSLSLLRGDETLATLPYKTVIALRTWLNEVPPIGELSQAATIRAYWIRWLSHARDEDVLWFHQQEIKKDNNADSSSIAPSA